MGRFSLLRRIGSRLASRDTAPTAWNDAGPASPGTAWSAAPGDWQAVSDLEAAPDGAWRATGNDPILLAPPVALPTTSCRYLVVRMAATAAAGTAMAQLFWAPEGAAGFSEANSACWTVVADGALRTYVVDLDGTSWRRAAVVHALRLDPLACTGTVRLDAVALVRDAPETAATSNARGALAARHIVGRGIECGALQNPLRLGEGARALFVDRLTEAQAREHYPELAGQPLVRPHLVADLHRLPLRNGSVDFCVGNHLLEHARDPIGALAELIRVVRPGGIAFVSVPDVGNPLDRLRPVTPFDHILADHEAELDRSAEDLAHYEESAASSHAEMTDDERRHLVETWVAQAYSIHFHTFDERSYRQLVDHVCALAGARVEEFRRNTCPDLDEYIAILRRES